MGDGDTSRDRAGEQQLSLGGAEPARRRRRPRSRDAGAHEALAGEHVPLGIGWIDEADDDLVAVPLSTTWSPAPAARRAAGSAVRHWPLLRLPGEIAWPAGVGLVGLAAGVLVLSVGALPGFSGSGEPPGEARPSAVASVSQVASRTAAAVDPAWVTRVSARMEAAEAERRREAAAKRRERARREARQRARERASEALPVSADAAPAPSSPAPAPDPWAGVSPMERQATPGPWNNGGST